jgi:hypothetical protein
MPLRAYTTTVISDDGAVQGFIGSLPSMFQGFSRSTIASFAEEFGLDVGPQVDESALADMLQQLASETSGRRATLSAIDAVIQEMIHQPIVILESSPPALNTLWGIVSQVPASVLIADGKPLLAIAVDLGLVVVWFAGGPVRGARDGMQAAARNVSEELFEDCCASASDDHGGSLDSAATPLWTTRTGIDSGACPHIQATTITLPFIRDGAMKGGQDQSRQGHKAFPRCERIIHC